MYIVRRTQIYLDEGQAAQLSRHAGEAGRSMSDLIREAIDALLVARAQGPGPARSVVPGVRWADARATLERLPDPDPAFAADVAAARPVPTTPGDPWAR